MFALLVDTASAYTVRNFFAWEICPFPPNYLFIQSFLYISAGSWIFTLHFALQSSMTLSSCSHCSRFGHRELCQLARVLLACRHHCKVCFCVCFCIHFLFGSVCVRLSSPILHTYTKGSMPL